MVLRRISDYARGLLGIDSDADVQGEKNTQREACRELPSQFPVLNLTLPGPILTLPVVFQSLPDSPPQTVLNSPLSGHQDHVSTRKSVRFSSQSKVICQGTLPCWMHDGGSSAIPFQSFLTDAERYDLASIDGCVVTGGENGIFNTEQLNEILSMHEQLTMLQYAPKGVCQYVPLDTEGSASLIHLSLSTSWSNGDEQRLTVGPAQVFPRPPIFGRPILFPFVSKSHCKHSLRRERHWQNSNSLSESSRDSTHTGSQSSAGSAIMGEEQVCLKIIGVQSGARWLWQIENCEGETIATLGDVDLVLRPVKQQEPVGFSRDPRRQPTVWFPLHVNSTASWD